MDNFLKSIQRGIGDAINLRMMVTLLVGVPLVLIAIQRVPFPPFPFIRRQLGMGGSSG